MKTKKVMTYTIGLLCVLALGACSVKVYRWVEGSSHRMVQKKKFFENSAAFKNAFEHGAYDEAFLFACACEEAGRDWPNNELFLREGRFTKALAAEMSGEYDVASASYAAYKADRAHSKKRGCVVTSEPRLAYKKGKMDEAFRGYCELFALEKEDSSSGKPALNPLRFPKTATSIILHLDYAEQDRVLSPFAEYSDFLTFMEEEFKAQGDPAKYAEAMEFFRLIAADASDGDAGNKSVKAEESDVSDVPEPDGETSKTQAEATK